MGTDRPNTYCITRQIVLEGKLARGQRKRESSKGEPEQTVGRPHATLSRICVPDESSPSFVFLSSTMPVGGLSDLPVELFERVLEYLDIIDILRLKLVRTPSIIQRLPL